MNAEELKENRKPPQRGDTTRVRAKPLTSPTLGREQAATIDRYISALRRERAAATEAYRLERAVLRILRRRLHVARCGAVLKLEHSYRWQYGARVTALSKDLNKARERQRRDGTAKASLYMTVEFEDVRRKRRKQREEATQKGPRVRAG